MEGGVFWALAVLAALLIGLSKGGLPVVGMLGVPVLSLVISPVTAAGMLLPIFVASDIFGLWAYRRNFDLRVLKILIPATTLGVAFGWATASIVPERLVTGLVGLIGASFAAHLLLRRGERPAREARVGPGLFWGAAAGFTSFVSHAGAPPYQVYVLPLRLEKAVFAGTSTILFAYVNAIKLVPYAALGQLTPANLAVSAWLMLPAVAAVFLGVRLVRWLPEKLFFRLVVWALLLVSLRLMWQAAQFGI
ncbi:sulfite exporter TauE/SafE family protein [Fertoebacter nigrum]|uniref:Probable membrane transporter protein n=1 Tax=Fertoeibacter niger TaxID=2656921 RepID=A0A8X8H182_9RHOB|nr:sulfite exporter TauE/SafE family protein [Fertoeibacter niger]NUB44369.1 sulfite exporter TauE/SafE family protein [Fertoeibacter niger]